MRHYAGIFLLSLLLVACRTARTESKQVETRQTATVSYSDTLASHLDFSFHDLDVWWADVARLLPDSVEAEQPRGTVHLHIGSGTVTNDSQETTLASLDSKSEQAESESHQTEPTARSPTWLKFSIASGILAVSCMGIMLWIRRRHETVG